MAEFEEKIESTDDEKKFETPSIGGNSEGKSFDWVDAAIAIGGVCAVKGLWDITTDFVIPNGKKFIGWVGKQTKSRKEKKAEKAKSKESKETKETEEKE